MLPNSVPSRIRSKEWTNSGVWQATVIFLPLLILASLGLYGIQVSRQSKLDRLREKTNAAMDDLMGAVWKKMDEVRPIMGIRPYPSCPVPAQPNENQDLYTKALEETSPELALQMLDQLDAQLKIEEYKSNDHPDSLAKTGIPLRPLMELARLRRITDPDRLVLQARALAESAISVHPSIISISLLDAAEQLLKERGVTEEIFKKNGVREDWTKEFRTRWLRDEKARQYITFASVSVSPVENAHLAIIFAGPIFLFERERGNTYVAYRFEEIQRELTGAVMQELHKQSLDQDISIQMNTNSAPAFMEPENPGLTLCRNERDGLTIECQLSRQSRLLTEQRRQTYWLLATVACAFSAALFGFLKMRRTVNRERELGELKSNFIASVSHELRAPLAAMRVLAENLDAGYIAEESKRKRYHQMIAEECRRLSTLIDNVLDFARIEQDRKAYRFDEADVAALTKDAVELMQARAAQRRQTLTAHIESIDPPPILDPMAIQQAAINLIDNAIKFSPDGTEITITTASLNGTEWTLSVADHGPGIPEHEHQRIFERFYRIGSELRRETQGAGIGLSIVEHIVQAHHGRIQVESKPGHGTRFTLHFPKQRPTTIASN